MDQGGSMTDPRTCPMPPGAATVVRDVAKGFIAAAVRSPVGA